MTFIYPRVIAMGFAALYPGALGAAAGCLYGRHRAHEQEKQQEQHSQANGNGKI